MIQFYVLGMERVNQLGLNSIYACRDEHMPKGKSFKRNYESIW